LITGGCISGKAFGLFYLILNTFIADDGGIEAALPPAKKFSLRIKQIWRWLGRFIESLYCQTGKLIFVRL
jgi:hypothetical protein